MVSNSASVTSHQSIARRILKLTSLATVTAGIIATIILEIILYIALKAETSRQAQIWENSLPAALLPHLVDSDGMPIKNKIFLVQNTDLFSYLAVKNKNGIILASFGELDLLGESRLIPVVDEVGTSWGSITLTENRLAWASQFITFGFCVLLLFMLLALVIRALTKRIVQAEMFKFNRALETIAELKKRVASQSLHEFSIEFKTGIDPESEEEVQVQKLATSLLAEIHKLNQEIRKDEMEKAEAERRIAMLDAIAKSTKMLAHDVRKPLNLIKVLSQILKNVSTVEDFRNIMNRFQPELDRATASVQSLVEDVMEASRQKNLVLNKCSLVEIIGQLISEITLTEKHPNIVIEYVFDHKHKVLADQVRLSRALTNIFQNAVQAIGDRREKIWFITTEVASITTLVIGNSGSFMEKDDCEKAFESFFTKQKIGGTGFGLMIVKKIITAHGGEVFCRSDKSAGTEFVLTIPCSDEVDHSTADKLPLKL